MTETLPPDIEARIKEQENAMTSLKAAFESMQRLAEMRQEPADEIIESHRSFKGDVRYTYVFNGSLAHPSGRLRTMTVNVYREGKIGNTTVQTHAHQVTITSDWDKNALINFAFEYMPIASGYELADVTSTSKLLLDKLVEKQRLEVGLPPVSILDAPPNYAPGIQ